MDPRFQLSLGTVLLGQGGGGNPFALAPLILGIGALFYFMVLRPETQRRSDQEKMHKELKKNDRIVTIGGIYGTIVNTDGDDVTIKVDENTNTRIRITRTAVQTVLNQKDGGKDS